MNLSINFLFFLFSHFVNHALRILCLNSLILTVVSFLVCCNIHPTQAQPRNFIPIYSRPHLSRLTFAHAHAYVHARAEHAPGIRSPVLFHSLLALFFRRERYSLPSRSVFLFAVHLLRTVLALAPLLFYPHIHAVNARQCAFPCSLPSLHPFFSSPFFFFLPFTRVYFLHYSGVGRTGRLSV